MTEKGKPWIVSLSDIESNYDFFIDSLKLVDQQYGVPIVNFDGNKITWAGNNYNLIINGDLFQHSRLENPQTKELASSLTNLVESAPKGSVMFTVGNHDVGMFIERYKNPDKEEMDEIGEFASRYRKWIESDIVRAAIPGHNFTYVHAGQMNEWKQSDYEEANKLVKELNGRHLKSLGLEYVVSKRGENDSPLSSVPFNELSKKERIQKLIGVGNTSLGNGTGKNPHAGITWIRPKMLKQGPAQIVGHTGFKRPWRYNDLVMENTQAGSLKQPSVVVEKPHGAYGLTKEDGEYKL